MQNKIIFFMILLSGLVGAGFVQASVEQFMCEGVAKEAPLLLDVGITSDQISKAEKVFRDYSRIHNDFSWGSGIQFLSSSQALCDIFIKLFSIKAYNTALCLDEKLSDIDTFTGEMADINPFHRALVEVSMDTQEKLFLAMTSKENRMFCGERNSESLCLLARILAYKKLEASNLDAAVSYIRELQQISINFPMNREISSEYRVYGASFIKQLIFQGEIKLAAELAVELKGAGYIDLSYERCSDPFLEAAKELNQESEVLLVSLEKFVRHLEEFIYSKGFYKARIDQLAMTKVRLLLIYLELGKREKALSLYNDLQKMSESDPKEPILKNKLAYAAKSLFWATYEEQKNLEPAIPYLLDQIKYLIIAPPDRNGLDTLKNWDDFVARVQRNGDSIGLCSVFLQHVKPMEIPKREKELNLLKNIFAANLASAFSIIGESERVMSLKENVILESDHGRLALEYLILTNSLLETFILSSIKAGWIEISNKAYYFLSDLAEHHSYNLYILETYYNISGKMVDAFLEKEMLLQAKQVVDNYQWFVSKTAKWDVIKRSTRVSSLLKSYATHRNDKETLKLFNYYVDKIRDRGLGKYLISFCLKNQKIPLAQKLFDIEKERAQRELNRLKFDHLLYVFHSGDTLVQWYLENEKLDMAIDTIRDLRNYLKNAQQAIKEVGSFQNDQINSINYLEIGLIRLALDIGQVLIRENRILELPGFYRMMNVYEESISSRFDASRIDHLRLLRDLSIVYSTLGQFEKAERCLSKMEKIGENDSLAQIPAMYYISVHYYTASLLKENLEQQACLAFEAFKKASEKYKQIYLYPMEFHWFGMSVEMIPIVQIKYTEALNLGDGKSVVEDIKKLNLFDCCNEFNQIIQKFLLLEVGS